MKRDISLKIAIERHRVDLALNENKLIRGWRDRVRAINVAEKSNEFGYFERKTKYIYHRDE